jgi:hypothetical protein
MKTIVTLLFLFFSLSVYAQPEPEPICGKTRFHHYLDSTLVTKDATILDKAFYIWVNVSAEGEINCTYKWVRKEGYRYSRNSFHLMPEFMPDETLQFINNVIKQGPEWQPASSEGMAIDGRKLILFSFNRKKLVFDWQKRAYLTRE